MSRMRVCYVVNHVDETSVPASIGLALEEHTDVTVDILAWFGCDPFEGDDRLGVQCLAAPRNGVGIDRDAYRRARERLEQYDLVQAHHNHSGSFAKAIARRVGVPSISREGNVRSGFTRQGRIANGITNPLAEFVVCNSRAVYQSFKRWERALLSDASIRIIPNGVDLERVHQAVADGGDCRTDIGVDPDTVLVGTAGALEPQKAPAVLVRAIHEANRQSDQRFELVIAGDGPLRSDVEALAESLGVESNVHLLGQLPRTDVYRLLDEVDIYAMPSRWEGFANAAVEALGVGNACVFSDIDPFTIPYEEVALFHEVDDHEHLAEQLLRLADNPKLRSTLRAKSQALVEREYTLEAIARQYRDLYREALST